MLQLYIQRIFIKVTLWLNNDYKWKHVTYIFCPIIYIRTVQKQNITTSKLGEKCVCLLFCVCLNVVVLFVCCCCFVDVVVLLLLLLLLLFV